MCCVQAVLWLALNGVRAPGARHAFLVVLGLRMEESRLVDWVAVGGVFWRSYELHSFFLVSLTHRQLYLCIAK